VSYASHAAPPALAGSHGFRALADDGPVGRVETPIFPPDSRDPDYLILRAEGEGQRARHPVVPVALVENVDLQRRVVHLRGTVRELAHLPESLPLASRGGS
jgi:hypothetical protein